MTKPGPRPKPTNLRVLHGDQAHRINTDEPQPRADVPDKPDNLGEHGSAAWDVVVPELHRMGLVYAVDCNHLIAYCRAVQRFNEADQLMNAGILVRGAKGNLVKNPAWQIWRESALTMLRFAQEYGLTASARSQLKAPKRNNDDLDDLLADEA